jgi:hypothetical protein
MKKGLHPETHAVIFTGKGPVTQPGEKLTKKSIRMLPNSEREKLDHASRINYAKVYTVEHNVKVFFIGSIAPKYEQRFLSEYQATHPPMPDRPYKGEITDDVFDHAEGPDPNYSAQHATNAPWQISHTERYNYHPSTPRYESSLPMEAPTSYPRPSSLYSHHSPEGVGAGHAPDTQAVGEFAGEAIAVETQPREFDKTLYDVSD